MYKRTIKKGLLRIVGALLLTTFCNASHASSLQVAPVLIDVALPSAASALQLRNFGANPITAQVRVYRWSQENGSDHLTETRDVVASPPLVEIAPNVGQLVRIVRVSKEPLQSEESYRLLVDEIPQRSSDRTSSVNFAVRYSIPVFFSGAGARSAPLLWFVEQQIDRLTVTASNTGTRRVRVASLQIVGPRGEIVAFGKGLTGYVLGGSTAQWSTKGKLSSAASGSTVTISANTENGPLQTTGIVRMAR
jgi:fimbrial chaperone protein